MADDAKVYPLVWRKHDFESRSIADFANALTAENQLYAIILQREGIEYRWNGQVFRTYGRSDVFQRTFLLGAGKMPNLRLLIQLRTQVPSFHSSIQED